MPQLSFASAFQPDVFHLAIANSVGIFIENARDPKMVARLPDWYKRSFSDAQSFVLLPVMALTGLYGVAQHPSVFAALNPGYGYFKVRCLCVSTKPWPTKK